MSATVDGMNDNGLVANVLYPVEAGLWRPSDDI